MTIIATKHRRYSDSGKTIRCFRNEAKRIVPEYRTLLPIRLFEILWNYLLKNWSINARYLSVRNSTNI